MRIRSLVVPAAVFVLGPVLLGASCDAGTKFNAPCPVQPATWNFGGTELNPADYTPAPRAEKSSIDIELDQLYMRRRIEQQLEKPPPNDPNPSSGIFVDNVTLSEQGTGAQKLNLLTLRITPWLRGQSGNPASLQRSYRLTLKVVPYLVTPSTVADQQQRQAFLGGGDNGAALRFELVDLYSLVNQEAVSCSSANYDLVDSQVLTGLYDSLGRQQPLVLPADKVTGMANALLGSTTKLTGMNVGSDLDLKIGLLLDQGTPTTFDPQTSLAHFSQVDWGVRLDTSFVGAAIAREARTAATAEPAATVNSINTSFVSNGIDVVVDGRLNKCGGINFTVNAHVTPLIRKRSDGKSILVAPSTQHTSNSGGPAFVCAVLDKIFSDIGNSIMHPQGSATATIGSGVCDSPMGDPIEFDVGPGDHFYATAVDTDGIFEVAGRSTFMDGLLTAPRPPVTPCP
jgi:hypothetical protein